MNEHFGFIRSSRFWALVMLALSVALNSYGVMPQETMNALITLLGGYIAVGTIDKFSKASQAASDLGNMEGCSLCGQCFEDLEAMEETAPGTCGETSLK